jgi:hypothetical protein
VVPKDDRDPRAVRAGLALYRCVLRLYPRSFQDRFADELEEAFHEMSRDAWRGGGAGALRRWWLDAAIDAIRSLVREWLETPWLPIAIVSALIAAGVFWASVGRSQIPLRAFRSRVVPGAPSPPDSPALLLLMVLMVLIPVAGILVFWGIARLIRHEPPSRRDRA